MDFDLASAVVERALDDVRARRPLADVFSRALDLLDSSRPAPLWRQLRATDTATDLQATEVVVRGLVRASLPPPGLSGLWFGLHEIAELDDLSDVQPVISLTGGTTFPDDDWLFDQDWSPSEFLPTPVLRGLASGASVDDDPDLAWLVTYALTFAYAVGLVAEVLRGDAGGALLGDRASLAVAVGFHDGDIVLLGSLSADGLDTADMDWV